MMSIMRALIGAPIAAIVTIALFLVMAGLVNQDPNLSPPKPRPEFSITAKKRPPEERIEPPPKLPEPPEPVDIQADNQREPVKGVDAGATPLPPASLPAPIVAPGGYGGAVVKIAPQYPEQCRARGAEGIVIVQFDVTPEGQVVNPVIVHSDHPCFNRTVLRTIQRYKYPPSYRSGTPVARRGVVERFSFELSE